MPTSFVGFVSKMNLSSKDTFPIAEQKNLLNNDEEIHKCPKNIRKSMKLGKHRKNYRVSKYEHKETNSSIQKLKLQIVPYDTKITIENSLCSPESFRQKQYTEKLMSTTDRMFYQKKKLSPIKKNFKGDRNSLKITFLNIQKINLAQMNVGPSVASRYYLEVPSALQHYPPPLSLKKTAKQCRSISHYKPQIKPKLKIKSFSAPFSRYYYKDFIWKVAFSNGLLFESPIEYSHKFKAFVGNGNNSALIRSLLKRRSAWWTFTEKIEQANFVWTQIKVVQYYKLQQKNIQISDQKGQKKLFCQQGNEKILNSIDLTLWIKYFLRHRGTEDRITEDMTLRNRLLSKEGLTKKSIQKNNSLQAFNKCKQTVQRIHNHLPNNYIIGNKKALFSTMSKYYQLSKQNVFDYLPLTFHIKDGLQDPQYLHFLKHYYERAKMLRKTQTFNQFNMWIVKPGQFTNRGNGISVCLTLQDIKIILKKREKHADGILKTYILQVYLANPFLYQRRKFDIRHYIMVTSVNGRIKGYWYELGYIRTTSTQYSPKNAFSSVHLTNDAVQKQLPDYGKYEKANKISYEDFQKYLDKQYQGKYDFYTEVYPKIKKIATDVIKASALVLDSEKNKHNFQIFGLDFMIDDTFRPWLIEVNNNPCLELACPLLADIIPNMVQNALKIALDSVIFPPSAFNQKRPYFNQNVINNNKFEIVYDSVMEEAQLRGLFRGQINYKQIYEKQEEQVYEDDGHQLED